MSTYRCRMGAGFVVALITLCVVTFAPAHAARPAIEVGTDHVDVSFQFPAPTFVTRDGGLEPHIAEYQSLAAAPGEPVLPITYVTLVLPPGTRPTGVSVRGESDVLPGTYHVTWGQEPQRLSEPPRARTRPAAKIYTSDDLYPVRIAEVAGTGFFRGYHLATLAVRPMQWRAVSSRLYAFRTLRVSVALGPDATRSFAPLRGLRGDVSDLTTIAGNPETAYLYGAPEAARTAEVPYLIVTTGALRPAFERLLAHREAHGMHGEILTLDQVYETYGGRDRAEQVREAIRDYYTRYGTTFVLLGGDDTTATGTPLFPVRRCAGQDNMVSDYYFGALDGTWDDNHNGTFCEQAEVDYYAEVHIGRATVNNLEDTENFVDKVITFESGLPEERRTDLVFMGEKLDDATYGDDAKNRVAGLIGPPYAIDTLYARDETFSSANVIERLNRGPQLTNHCGHSSQFYVMGISNPDVDALVNDSPFFSYSIGCWAGAFDWEASGVDQAISEHFIKTKHGAAGVVMNSRYGIYYVGGYSGLSDELDYDFYRALFVTGLRTVGEANDQSRADNAGTAQTDTTMLYCFLETNLSGDPAMPAQLRRNQVTYAASRVIDADPARGNGNGYADPGETIELAVTLSNQGGGTAAGVSARLTSSTPGVVVHDGWAAWPDLAAGQSAEDSAPHFRVELNTACGTNAAFRLEIAHDGIVDVSTFALVVGSTVETTIRSDDFETSTGWTRGGNALTGQFVRQDPNGLTDPFSGPVSPDDDHTQDPGHMCWVTGNPAPNSDPHQADINSGNTFITSPRFNGSGDGRLLLRFARWFHRSFIGYNESWASAQVSVDDGATWTEVEHLETNLSKWMTREIDLSSIVTPSATMRVRFEAKEVVKYVQQPDSLTKLLVDDVSLVRRSVTCAAFTGPIDTQPPGPVGASLRIARSGPDVVLSWAAPVVDAANGVARSYPVLRSAAVHGGFIEQAEPTLTTWHDVGSGDPAYGDFNYLLTAKNAAGTSGEEPTP